MPKDIEIYYTWVTGASFYCENLLKSVSVWSHPRLGNLNEAHSASVKSYLHKYCDYFQNTAKISWSLSEGSPKLFQKKADLKNFTKNLLKRNYWEVLSSVTSQPATSLKKNPITVIFWWLLKRFFRILFIVRTLVKQQKELKYLTAYVLVKSWYQEFQKIHPKETMMEFF